jgi:hypothetical protein
MRALNAGWIVILSQFTGESLSIAQQRSKVVWSEARLATQGMLDDRGQEGENFSHRLVSKNAYRRNRHSRAAAASFHWDIN